MGFPFPLVLLAVLAGVGTQGIAARLDLTVTPSVIDLVCEPGKAVEMHFVVDSETPEPMCCSVAANRMEIDDGVPSPSTDTGLEDGSPYLSFAPVGFTIPKGKSSTVVTVRVMLPRGTVGACYAIVAFSAVPQAKRNADAGAQIVPEVRAVVMVTPKSPPSVGTPRPVDVCVTSGREPGSGARGVWRAEATIRNTGNRHVALDARIAIKSVARRLIDSAALQAGSGLVFPQRERVFRAVGRKPLPDGSYQATVSVSPRGGGPPGSQAVYFLVKGGKVEITGTQKPASSG